MSCLVTRPSPRHGVCAPLKARRELRHGMLACLWGRAVMPEPLDSPAIRLQIYKLFYQCNTYEEEILKNCCM